MQEHEAKILTLDELIVVREQLREQRQQVVQCHGCFDIVHPGHIRYLQAARQHGDVLIVSVSADEVVGKGFDRPYIHEQLRMENLAVLEIVDYVVLDHHSWAGDILEALKPDVYVKGKEYETNRDPRFLKERTLVEAYGGQVVFSSGDVVFSSTRIISKYRERMDLEHQKVQFFCRQHQLDVGVIEQTLVALQDKKVVVVGDPILDVYVHCEMPTVASEAAVLTVTPIEENAFVGGAGLIAAQLAVLGAQVHFVTVHNGDEDASRLQAELERLGVHVEALKARRPAFVKRRFLVDGQKVFKVDTGTPSPLPASTRRQLGALLESYRDSADGLVVTDFGYGFFGDALCSQIQELGTSIPLFADVSGRGAASLLKLGGTRVATPTEDELRFAMGDPDSGLSVLAQRYLSQTSSQGLLLTLGKKGALHFYPQDAPGVPLRTEYLPSLAGDHVRDTVGAGDVMLSGIVTAELAGASRALGLYLGSVLAALHVNNLGNVPVSLLDLQAVLQERPELAGP